MFTKSVFYKDTVLNVVQSHLLDISCILFLSHHPSSGVLSSLSLLSMF